MGIETTASKLSKILETKAAIKQSITNKGVSIPEGTVFGEYPALIDSIEVGSGGSGSDYENPDFYEIRTDGGTIYRGLFYYYRDSKLDVSNFDTSKVTDMSYMFSNCMSLKELDIRNFDTSKVTRMYNMFDGCESLTSLDLSSFDTSNITDMSYMFANCLSLKELDIRNFDTSKVTNMNRMFQSCSKLTTITGEFDLSGLTNGFYSGSSTYLFFNCNGTIETLYLKNIYKNCTMTNASKWSINLSKTIVKDECLLYIINELPDLKNDKGLTATDKIVLTLPKTNTLTQEQVQVAIDKGWSVANTTY